MLSEAALPKFLPTRARGRHLYIVVALLGASVVFVDFAPRYFLKGFSDRPLLPLLAHLHGFVLSAWIMLFVAQTTLIRGDGATCTANSEWSEQCWRSQWSDSVRHWHFTAQLSAGRSVLGFPPLQFLALKILDLVQFIVFVAFAVAWRRRPETHKRLMLLATLTLSPRRSDVCPCHPCGSSRCR